MFYDDISQVTWSGVKIEHAFEKAIDKIEQMFYTCYEDEENAV